MRIWQIIGSALWMPLLVCLGILAASIDNFPDLPALRQATIGSRICQDLSHRTQADSSRFATDPEQREPRRFWPQLAIELHLNVPVLGRDFSRHESDSSPPSPAPL